MVHPSSRPVVPLGVLRGNPKEVLRGLVGVERDGPTALLLAVVVGLDPGELLALFAQEEGQDVPLAVPEVVGLGRGTSGALAVKLVVGGQGAAGGGAAAAAAFVAVAVVAAAAGGVAAL